MSGGAAEPADVFFTPRETPWFRARLALRVAVPPDPAARAAAVRLAWAAAVAAPPLMVAMIAPAATLTPGSVFALCCSALPGGAATAWSASRLREAREVTARALRQAGAEQRTAWLLAAGRLALFAGLGAAAGAVWIAMVHVPLARVLPRRSPLHAMFDGRTSSWISAAVLTVVFAVAGALLAGSPRWAQVDWNRYDPARLLRRVAASRPVRLLRPPIRRLAAAVTSAVPRPIRFAARRRNQSAESNATASLSVSTTGTPTFSSTGRLDEPPV
jgi:hypothetical protein